MRYITLTDKCLNFEFSSQENSDFVKLIWNVPHDFSEVSYIGIHSFHLSELKNKSNHHDYHIRLSSNLIARTITNPTRNILDIRIPKNSVVAECRLNTSKYTCVNIDIDFHWKLIKDSLRFTWLWCWQSWSNCSDNREYHFEISSPYCKRYI